jgi:hypothetical protein
VSTLEDRLRAELRAESELIESVPELSLPAGGRAGRRTRQRWPAWVTPLAAAAAVLAVVAGTLTAVRVLSGSSAHSQTGAPSAAALPAYYAVTVSGDVTDYTSGGTQYSSSVLGRSIQIRATATGAVVATVRPPAPYNDFAVLTGTPDGRTFVFGAERYWGFRGAKSPLTGALDPAAPLRFVLLHVSPDGLTRWSALSMPMAIRPGQQPSIALSPDGTKLAVAYGGGGQAAVLRVVTLTTGQDLTWQWPHVSWTPLIQGQGAWTADERTVVLQQWNVVRGSSSHPVVLSTTTAIWLVNATDDGARTRLTLRAPAGLSAPGGAYLTPDGSELITTSGTSDRALLTRGVSRGMFAVYSARTGTLIRTLAPWTWNQIRPVAGNRFPAPAVAWSDPAGSQLLVLLPHNGVNRLAVLAGGTVVLAGGGLLPAGAAAYASLQSALPGVAAVPPSMAW